MSFLIQKKGLTGFNFHPNNTFEEWYEIDKEFDKDLAKYKAIELSKKENGTYRVYDIYSGDISFSINT